MKLVRSIGFLLAIASIIGSCSRVSKSGSMFIAKTWEDRIETRERKALELALAGGIPDYLLDLIPVNTGDHSNKITFFVSPDYISLGSDDDHVLFPFNFISASKIAKRYHAVLPTSKMVDLIYQQSEIKLKPRPMKPGSRMASSAYIKKHDQSIKSSLSNFRDVLSTLVAGHKKDTVISRKLIAEKDRIAIYGWHSKNHSPIQPLNVWHWSDYADYSHGVRLVDRRVLVNGEVWDIAEVLKSREYAPYLSKEGVLDIDKLMSPRSRNNQISKDLHGKKQRRHTGI